MDSPKESDWKACKIILRYVSGIKKIGILCSTSKNLSLIRYTDNESGRIIDDKKITYGCTFHFCTGVVSWASKKQPIETLYSAEENHVTATSTACQSIWMQRMLKYLS